MKLKRFLLRYYPPGMCILDARSVLRVPTVSVVDLRDLMHRVDTRVRREKHRENQDDRPVRSVVNVRTHSGFFHG